MKKLPARLLEINAYCFLAKHSLRAKSLAQIPESVWKKIAAQGYDAVWLMGIWKRSPGARQIALTEPELMRAYDRVLPDWNEKDVAGSPYAVYDYEPDPYLGTFESLARLKHRVNKAGLLLFLDYVPNHLALDHPLTLKLPQMFVQGTREDLKRDPVTFYLNSKGSILAHGKDPHFPAWSDTVQMNYAEPLTSVFTVETLSRIASVADGVRCDMAMLGINFIFEKQWKPYVKKECPEKEFWETVIRAVKKKHPAFLFMAEAYWGLERRLLHLGFDFTYDKWLYDRLLHSAPLEIHNYLTADLEYQRKAVRFIENHDERRAMEAFGKERSFAAAAVIATLPGLRFFHEGQPEGRSVKPIIQLGREPNESPDLDAVEFYKKLLAWTSQPVFTEGEWQLADWADGPGHPQLLGWHWSYKGKTCLVVINYSESSAAGLLRLRRELLHPRATHLCDKFNDKIYTRATEEVLHHGLYIHLEPWKAHWFEWEK